MIGSRRASRLCSRRFASAIVTPDERHYGREDRVLARRGALYERARRAKPERWSDPREDRGPGRARHENAVRALRGASARSHRPALPVRVPLASQSREAAPLLRGGLARPTVDGLEVLHEADRATASERLRKRTKARDLPAAEPDVTDEPRNTLLSSDRPQTDRIEVTTLHDPSKNLVGSFTRRI